jgi:transposase-like protein
MTQRSTKACAKWRRLVSEQARSGKSVTEFCRRRGLHSSYFFVWKKRLRETPAARFLEVKVTERASISSDSRIEVRLPNGRSLVVERGFDANHLRALLAVVEPGT